MLSDLLLLSGNDIPFVQAQLSIHQPTIKEIAYIGEENFFSGCELLKFSKKNLPAQDKSHLENCTDFDIIMSIVENKKEMKAEQTVAAVYLVLTLMFPNYQIQAKNSEFVLTLDSEQHKINNSNFLAFKQILLQMFCLGGKLQKEYNPDGRMAQQIAEKLRAGRAKVAQTHAAASKISILSRYVSILAVAQNKDMNMLFNYTVYQLFDEFERYQLKARFQDYIKAKMLGAKNLKEAQDWTKDIH